ncbi:hypothetical protein PO909_032558 [Leuciscus waleckii]
MPSSSAKMAAATPIPVPRSVPRPVPAPRTVHVPRPVPIPRTIQIPRPVPVPVPESRPAKTARPESSVPKPPSPTSHLPPLNPSSATACQPLSSSNHLRGGGVAVGLPACSSSLVGGSPVSASNLCDQDSTSAHRSISSTLAPISLSSTMAHQFTSFARPPRPPGSTLVARRPTLASGLHSSGYISSLRPPGSIGLLTPFCSSLVLTLSDSTAPFCVPPAPQSPEPGLVGSPAPPWSSFLCSVFPPLICFLGNPH